MQGKPESYEYELPSDFEDEEIDDDEVFNESDYEKYGDVGGSGKGKGKGRGGKGAESEEESEEEEGMSDSEDEGETIDISDLLGMPGSRERDDDILGGGKSKKGKMVAARMFSFLTCLGFLAFVCVLGEMPNRNGEKFRLLACTLSHTRVASNVCIVSPLFRAASSAF